MDGGEAPYPASGSACGAAADAAAGTYGALPPELSPATWTDAPAQAIVPEQIAQPAPEVHGLNRDAAAAPLLLTQTQQASWQLHPHSQALPGAGHTDLLSRRPQFFHRLDVAEEMQSEGVCVSLHAGQLTQGEGAAMRERRVMDVMEAPSPMPSLLTSRSHLDAWHKASETLLLLDWDDTLFPTSYVWEDPRLRWDEPAPCFSAAPDLPADADKPDGPSMRDLLRQHSSTVAAFLRLAVSLGKVVIVTLSEEGWVDTSIRHFLPSLEGLLPDLGIDVVYCRSTVTPRLARMAHEDGQSLGKLLKTQVISRVVKEFYSGDGGDRREKSWKNVLSIGDSSVERLALQDVIFQRKQTDSKGGYKVCRCKAIKIMSEPSLEKLIVQLQVLTTWLQKLVLHDGDVDLDFSELDSLPPDSPVPSP